MCNADQEPFPIVPLMVWRSVSKDNKNAEGPDFGETAKIFWCVNPESDAYKTNATVHVLNPHPAKKGNNSASHPPMYCPVVSKSVKKMPNNAGNGPKMSGFAVAKRSVKKASATHLPVLLQNVSSEKPVVSTPPHSASVVARKTDVLCGCPKNHVPKVSLAALHSANARFANPSKNETVMLATTKPKVWVSAKPENNSAKKMEQNLVPAKI